MVSYEFTLQLVRFSKRIMVAHLNITYLMYYDYVTLRVHNLNNSTLTSGFTKDAKSGLLGQILCWFDPSITPTACLRAFCSSQPPGSK